MKNKIGQQGSKKSTLLKQVKTKNSFRKLQNMHVYCENCKKHT